MNRLEQRVRRLEEGCGACNHRSPVILANPTEEELARKRKELNECPSCNKHGQPKLVILQYPELDRS
jgi:hypothetical protein